MYISFFKRLIDFILATVGIVLLSPFLIYASWKIHKYDDGPIFYRGKRVGSGGNIFRIFKYRTMVIEADKTGPSSTSERDPRITDIGHFLRKYKLDEIPQLFNVWSGDMSFVGPRPNTKDMTDLYSESEKNILTFRPGITDFASIVFRNEGGIINLNAQENEDADETYLRVIAPDKHRLNLLYISKCSISTDIKLILGTAGAVLGIAPEWLLPEEERELSQKVNAPFKED